ncbi:MAG: hypothetical protein RLZZ450_5715 [Pseudomonadota bacterium]|jgi:hypothetical protein
MYDLTTVPGARGTFRLEYSELPGGRLQIRFAMDDVLESGPIILEREVVDELASLLDRATALISRGREWGPAPAQQPSETVTTPDEDHDERVPPLRTDPAALSPNSRLPR